MKAAVCKSLDGPAGIEIVELPDPGPGPGEAVVAVKVAALNFMDTLICRGKYQEKPQLPFSPAAEISGVIEALGESEALGEASGESLGERPGEARAASGRAANGLAVGQRVCAYLGWGGAREKIVVAADKLIPLPDGVSHDVAAGINVTYGTAFHGLKDRGSLAAGETVAVLGASGGAGLAAVEIAKRLGARVIAVASSEDKLRLCQAKGADHLLNYASQDLRQGLRDLTGGAGVDVIYDCVGGEHSEAALRELRWQGRLLVIGFAAGKIPRIPLNLTLLKGCDIRGVFWGRALEKDPGRHRANMLDLLGWIEAGQLKPHIHASYPLHRIGEAIGVLERREASGKVIVTL